MSYQNLPQITITTLDNGYTLVWSIPLRSDRMAHDNALKPTAGSEIFTNKRKLLARVAKLLEPNPEDLL